MEKKLRFFFFYALFLLYVMTNAQTIVSTVPGNRNVVLEEFTGINCVNCPYGHRIANEIATANPGRVFPVNIHFGDYAPTASPNYHCPDGDVIGGTFGPQAFPIGNVSRQIVTVNGTQTMLLGRDRWAPLADSLLQLSSCVNVAAHTIIDHTQRKLTILVEVYYTANSAKPTNLITVMLLQNNILGPQSGSTYNPEQIIDGKYCHSHMLRDVISECDSPWGDTIKQTTAGSFFTKTYEYPLPSSFNGIPVDPFDLDVVAFVSEKSVGTYSACLSSIERIGIGAIDPRIIKCKQEPKESCDHLAAASVKVRNYGSVPIQSLKIQYGLDGAFSTYTYNGNLPTDGETTILLPDFYLGIGQSKKLKVTILEENGIVVPLNQTRTKEITVSKNAVGFTDSDSIRVKIWQDRYGSEITWKLFASDNSVIASGGPYTDLPSAGTELHEEGAKLPVNDCYRFCIYDSFGDGINNSNGNGKYQITTPSGKIITSGDGKYGESDMRLFSKYLPGSTVEINVASESPAQGSVQGGGVINMAETMIILATPKEGYQFMMWTLNGMIVSATPQFSFRAIENGSYVAHFELINRVSYRENGIKLFPNPVTDVLTIRNEKNIERFEIYSITGQLLKSGKLSDNRVVVSDLPKGIYVLRIFNAAGMLQQQFVKN